jgi:Flp pilus assembly protein TadD
MIDAGDLKGAAEQLARIERDVAVGAPQKQLLLAFQGQVRARLGMRDEALGLMDRAIALDPTSDEAEKIRSVKEQIAH